MKTADELKALSIREFNKAAARYENDFAGIYEMCKNDYPPILEELEKEPFETLLDAGCGTAPMLSLLTREYPERRYTGLDLAPGMIEKAREKNLPNTTLVIGDCEDMPFDDGSFDVVINSQSFHHYPDPQAFFDSVARVLCPGGRLILRDNTTKSTVLAWLVNHLEMPLAHVTGHGDARISTLAEMRAYCDTAGLQVEKLEAQKGHRLHLVARKPGPSVLAVNASSTGDEVACRSNPAMDAGGLRATAGAAVAKSDNRPFWDRFAFLYGPFMAKNRRTYDGLSAHLRSVITPGMDVLELASGTGQMTERLAACAGTWVATDFSERMVSRLSRRRLAGVTGCEVADATNLPYEPGSFDCVLIANALHVMPDPDTALHEIHRVLKPGGLLIAPTFVYDDPINAANFKIVEAVGFKTYNAWTSKELSSYVQERGFEIASAQILPGNPASECALVAIRTAEG